MYVEDPADISWMSFGEILAHIFEDDLLLTEAEYAAALALATEE